MTIVRTAKEVARHVLFRTNADRLIMRRRLRDGQDTAHLALNGRESVFGYIYGHGLWRTGTPDSAFSGAGSDLETTATVRLELRAVLDDIKALTLLDVGCGDFTWMQHVDLSGIAYLGVDVVPALIAVNRARYTSSARSFQQIDAVAGPLPYADAVLCREILFHLSFDDCRSVLDNLRGSGARYLLATSDSSTAFNADIRTGDFRCLNLCKRPFRFPPPIRWIADDAVTAQRRLGLWRLSETSGSSEPRSAECRKTPPGRATSREQRGPVD
jgi:hypothetical protein